MWPLHHVVNNTWAYHICGRQGFWDMLQYVDVVRVNPEMSYNHFNQRCVNVRVKWAEMARDNS